MTWLNVADSAAMAKPLRVGLTLEQCWHRVPGGTASSALGLAAALDSRDDVEVLGISARHRKPPAEGWAPTVEVTAVPVPRPPLYELWHHLRWPHIEDSTGPLDVVHATGMAVPPARGPLVVTVHDLAFVHYPDQPTKRGLRFFNTALAMTRRYADLVHCPSQATADDCVDYGFPEERIRVVPWGLDWDVATDAATEEVRRSHGLDSPYVLFTGTLEPRKNLARLIEAFVGADLADTDLVLVGPDGWGDDVPDLDHPRVRALGFVPHSQLAPLYKGAAVFCYPSLLEGFGLPVLEAMSQGTPVITSAQTATAEVGGDAVIGVDPSDTGAIADALTRVLTDPDQAARMGAAGLERSRQYTWVDSAAGMCDVYAEVTR